MLGAEPHIDPLVGRVIDGKFEIESLIGRGGMGAVYRARQKTLKRSLAIKVLRHELLDDPAYAHRFKREATAASRLDHPNLMRVIDFGEDGNLLYIAMEFIDGKPLQSVMVPDASVEPWRIVELVSQLLAGLAAMHDEGIIHRDLKPENVMVVRGRDDDGNDVELVKLCDFGIAKQVVPTTGDPTQTGATHTATLTMAGSLVGTPDYMSPEQAKSEPVDGRADIYSVGVILYQMLTGRLPFRSSNSMKVLLAHISETPVRPSKLVATVDPLLEEICLRALAKNREGRYANAREMRVALRDALGLRDSAVLGARRAAALRSSVPVRVAPAVETPESATTMVDDVPTRRGTDSEITGALRDVAHGPANDAPTTPASGLGSSAGSGVVSKKDLPSSGTLATGQAVSPSPPPVAPAPAIASTVPPPPSTHVTAQTAAPSRTNRGLVALVLVLLIVIAVLVARR